MDPSHADRAVDAAHVAQLRDGVETASIDALVAHLDSPDSDVRAGAAWRLVEAADERPDDVAPVLDALLTAVDDPDVWVRRGASWVLADLAADRPAAVADDFPSLADLARDDDPLVRQNAVVAVAGVATKYPMRATSALSTMIALTDADDALVRRYAREAVADVTRELARRADGAGRPMLVRTRPAYADLFPDGVTVLTTDDADDRPAPVYVSFGQDAPRAAADAADDESRATRPPDDIPDLGDVALTTADLSPGRKRGRDSLTDRFRATVSDAALHHGFVQYRRLRPGPSAVTDAFADAVEHWAAVDDHDHVETVLGHGTDWVATRYADAGTLDARGAPRTLPAAAWAADAVTRAVSYAHNRGVVHGGLHPGVVRYVDVDPAAWDVPLVTDWGFAHAASARETPPIPAGYAAPEHRDPERYGRFDQATDVFGLGVVTYHLLTGVPPATDGDHTPPTARNPALPDAADALFSRALAPEKPARFATVLDFQRALDELTAALGGADA